MSNRLDSEPSVQIDGGTNLALLTSSIDLFRRRLKRHVQASDAKARFAKLLDEVERGETIVITRHGRAVARLSPDAERRQREVDQALNEIKELRKRVGKATREELLASRHEGHKY
jgi:prevent-host-death family protein